MMMCDAVRCLLWFGFSLIAGCVCIWECLYSDLVITFNCTYLFPLAPRCFDSEMEEILALSKASDELL